MNDPESTRQIAGAAGATGGLTGFWMFLEQLSAHGPSWSAVPPLVMAATSGVLAYVSVRRASQEMRHREEAHRARMRREAFGLPSVESLPDRN